MTGADRIVAARMRGVPVTTAFVGVWTFKPRLACLCDVDILPDDNPATVDLRCVAGLLVVVDGDAPTDRLIAVLHRVCDFQPARVVMVAPDLMAEYDPKGGLREWALPT